MRILAVAHYYLPDNRGGAEIMLHELLAHMASEGHEVWVAATRAPNHREPLVIDGVNVARGVIANDLLDQKWDRAITHLVESTRITTWAKRRRTHCTQLVHSDHGWIRLGLSNRPDLVVYNTEWLSRAMRSIYNGPSVVMHPPVHPEKYLTTPGDMVTLVNPLPEKGATLFYELARLNPDRQFLVVEGGYERERQVVKDLPNVTFQPSTSNMRDDVYARTRVLLMPSTYESYGMTGVEALVSGIPVIANPTPGLRESLGEAGIFPRIGDVDEWVQLLDKLFLEEGAWDRASEKALEVAGKLDTAGEVARCSEKILAGRRR